MAERWKVRTIHGRNSEDVETLSTLYAAMEWARMKGTEYHPDGVDCLGLMQKTFVLEQDGDRMWFQYGMNYHWVLFEKLDEPLPIG